jgi:hypothetical protein
MTLALDSSIRNGMLDQITTRAGASAQLIILSGTRPATGGAITTILAQLTCNATFAPGASGGVLTLNAITQDSSADATGTATWFRIRKSDGTTFVLDGDVGTSGSDLNLNSTSIVVGGTVSISSFTITAPNA